MPLSYNEMTFFFFFTDLDHLFDKKADTKKSRLIKGDFYCMLCILSYTYFWNGNTNIFSSGLQENIFQIVP